MLGLLSFAADPSGNGAAGEKQNSMLKSFTWPEFLLASIILSLMWWAGVWLLCYRGKGKSISPLPHSWEDEVEEVFDVLGKPALEQGASVVEAEAFSFAEGPEKEDDDGEVAGDGDPETDKVSRLGDISDVQQEIREVCRLLAAEDGTKEDFFTLFEMLRSRYPGIAGSAAIAALNGFIREHVPFALSEEELEGLWV